jgi:hypothetical protein
VLLVLLLLLLWRHRRRRPHSRGKHCSRGGRARRAPARARADGGLEDAVNKAAAQLQGV